MDKFSEDEFKSYQRLVELFKPIIPKPDLLLIFAPKTEKTSEGLNVYVSKLRKGVKNRLIIDKKRTQEIEFTRNKKSLRRQVIIVQLSVASIQMFWGVPILQLDVDPLRIYSDPEYKEEILDQIQLGLADYDRIKAETKIIRKAGRKVKKLNPPNAFL